MDRKEKILSGLDIARRRGVEIGPLQSPLVRKSDGDVVYVDHASTEVLRQKYGDDKSIDVSKIVEVDAIWGAQSLDQCLATRAPVDYVVASHVMEHVPDLISWLKEVRSVLSADGRLKLALPDRRYTFDYLRRESQVIDVLNAYLLKARTPLPIAILDHIMNSTTVDCAEAWTGKIFPQRVPGRLDTAIAVARDNIENKSYHDVHCWVFTCETFKTLMADIADLGFLPFACDEFYPTELNQLEFFVSLRPCDNPAEAAASFRRIPKGSPLGARTRVIHLLHRVRRRMSSGRKGQ